MSYENILLLKILPLEITVQSLKGFSIKRSVLKRASAYKGSATYSMYLCLAEKLCILTADKQSLLNRRSELISKCRHENKFYAENLKFQPSTQAVT